MAQIDSTVFNLNNCRRKNKYLFFYFVIHHKIKKVWLPVQFV
jgi:hypothetical protein